MSFLYPLLHFLQPGILFPDLAVVRPMQVVGFFAVVVSLLKKSQLDRAKAFSEPAFIWLVAFLLVQMVSVYRSGGAAVVGEAGYWLAHLQFVVVSLLVITDEKALQAYVRGMLCGSMFVVAYGIHAVLVHSQAAVGGRAGAYGMYENHNDYTFLIVQILPIIYFLQRENSSFIGRWALRACMASCIAGVFLSLSRGGVLALLLEMGLLFWVALPRRRLVLMPVVAAIGVAAISYQWSERAANQGDNYTAADSERSRLELWTAAGNMMLSNPLLGIGSRTFGEQAPRYGEISNDNRGKNSHNTFVEVAATSGLLGLLTFYKMLRWTQRRLRPGPAEAAVEPRVAAIRTAALIGLYAICFRALFDAKAHDWSFYLLLVLGVATSLLRRPVAVLVEPATAGAPPLSAGPTSAGRPSA